MNHLAVVEKLSNRYFVLRHGSSQANELNIILSNPLEGTKGYGLTPTGKEQVTHSVLSALKSGLLDETTIIYSSDFTRARETAEIAKKLLNTVKVIIDSRLCERFFGEWEKTHKSNNQKVWDDDEKNAYHTNQNVESTSKVLDRTTALIIELESTYQGKKVLLISHGDTLQILQTGFEKVSPAKHRQLPHLQKAEIREMYLKKTVQG
jgi:glucosyl-3-phosphoglycerate phosphatase